LSSENQGWRPMLRVRRLVYGLASLAALLFAAGAPWKR
jgi:hypothetical protein